jgi:predicted RNA binding protein YcfA (HicA-like mRNA interferase family)
MDDLLVGAKRPRTLISSTGLPDLTNQIKVGADDMLLNALSQMNRKSKTYLFLDQSLEKDAGQISIYTPPKTALTPKFYVRGSISQVDSSVMSGSLDLNADDKASRTGQTQYFGGGDSTFGRDVSIVTVDMHLVSFPDKTVVPGSSVANSMVVNSRSFSNTATGLIDVTGLDATLQINRIESLGQAVRNLIELGAIELIGRHANVAYWECLNIPAVKQRKTNRKEIAFTSADKLVRIPEVQKMLQQLGYYSASITGIVDQRTRDSISHFQATHGLIATGDLNYDTYQHLLEKTKGYAPRRRTEAPETQFEEAPKPDTKKLVKRMDRAGFFKSAQKGSLDIKSTKRQYKVGDTWQTYIVLPRGGFLSCFHQSGSGSITQILPSKPDVAFAVGTGQEILLPDPNDGFDIKFETKGLSEAVLCILEVAKKPADLSDIVGTVPLTPTKARSFEHLISLYRERSGNIMWGQVQAKG